MCILAVWLIMSPRINIQISNVYWPFTEYVKIFFKVCLTSGQTNDYYVLNPFKPKVPLKGHWQTVDPDQTPQKRPTDLDLHCLPFRI